MKIKNILAATAITAWSGMACAGFVTTFGQTANGFSIFPLTTYSAAANARNAFLGGSTASFYDFETAAEGATSLNISLGGVTASISGGGKVATAPLDGTDEGRYSVSGVSGSFNQGSKYWEATAPIGSTSSFKLEFSAAVDSFGFFGTDIGDFGGRVSMVLTRTNGTTVTIDPVVGGPFGNPLTGTPADASVLFFGVRATVAEDYFRSVQFIASGGSAPDVFGFDMFTVSAAPGGSVPAPGSLALVGAALGGLALVRRRR